MDTPSNPGALVVAGTDGSERAQQAVAWGAEEAAARGAELLVVHAALWAKEALELPVFADEDRLEHAILDRSLEVARRTAPGIGVSGRLVGPPAGEALVEASNGALLLVVGAHTGHGDWSGLGSVSQYCVRHARCPVLVIRG